MKRILLLVLAGLWAGFLMGNADAAPEPMQITGSRYLYQTVEQQNHIVNDTGCAWDPDDSVSAQAQGYLEGGFQIASCVIADGSAGVHLLGIDFRTPQSRPFTATVQMGEHTITYPSEQQGKYQRVRACLQTPRYDMSFPFPPVGSNGGVGVSTSVIYTMQLNGERRANSAVMSTILVADHSGHQADLCGTTYTGGGWPHCEGDPFVDGRVCYQ